MNKTKIEWCDSTWNPVTGCLHGCEYCYARRIANRFGKVDPLVIDEFKNIEKAQCFVKPDNPYPYLFKPTYHRYRLDEPARKTKGQNIFVCSMADLFGDWVPDEWIKEVFEACKKAPQHNYLFLTKRLKGYKDIEYPKNVWLGNTITRQSDFIREYGRPLNAKRFYSIEPILEPIKITQIGVPKWVIIGAETGNRKDKVIPKKEWIDDIVEKCKANNSPVFMKDSLVPIVGEENMLREFPEGLRR